MSNGFFAKNFSPVFIAYGLALAVAVITVLILPFGLILRTLVADIVATFVMCLQCSTEPSAVMFFLTTTVENIEGAVEKENARWRMMVPFQDGFVEGLERS